ncbi:MAG: flagellar basal body L-ring protein FlgH [Planctomycetota bacterium]
MKRWLRALLVSCATFGCVARAETRAIEVDNPYGETSQIAQPRASKKHDRVTLVINDSMSAAHEAKVDTSKKAAFKWSFANLFKITKDKDGDLIALPFPDVRKPELDVDTERTQEGDGKTDTKSSSKTVLSGEVIEVLPNGHLVVEARSSLTVNDEERWVIFAGRVDPATLNSDNSVDAKYVMDRMVKFTGKGAISAALNRGWLSRAFDFLNPF